MQNSPQHSDFILRTDRKSLFTQLNTLVQKAIQVSNEELEARRDRLRALINYEDKHFEEEFARKVRSRIDEDIQKRKDKLLKIKERSKEGSTDFLKVKRVQQYMNGCYEIREALRKKDRQNVRICQEEQILENERKIARERELDKYWLNVQCLNWEREDNRQRGEDCLKKQLARQNKEVLDMQMEEQERKREELLEEKRQDAEKLAHLLEEMRLESFNKETGLSPKQLQYRQDLLDAIEAKKQKKCAEETEKAEMHRQLIRDLQRLDAEDNALAIERKRALYKATMEYLAYLKRFREMHANQQKMRDNRIDELGLVDACTKFNIGQEKLRKEKLAALCHAELRRQMCEQYERRLREEAEYRENKILENRFAKPEKTREEILAMRRKNREELDKQIEVLKRVRAEEEKQFATKLRRASDDPEFCKVLCEEFMSEGVDYLPPHGNWRLLSCPEKYYIPKPEEPYPECDDVPPEGAGNADKRSSNGQLCGCALKDKPPCCY